MANVAIVIPFGSKKIYRDFGLATALLQGTINSITNQDSSNYVVAIGCHEIPDVDLNDHEDKVRFVQMSYDPLEEQYKTNTVRDMLMKIFSGLLAIKDEDFDYCMLLDADDRIHTRLIAHITSQRSTDAWVMDKGFRVDHPSKRVFKDKNLNNICGSTVVLSREVAHVPQSYTTEEFTKCWWHKNTHKDIKEYCSRNNLGLEYVPFYSVHKTINTGMNLSDSMFPQLTSLRSAKDYLRFHLLGRKMSEDERNSFGYR